MTTASATGRLGRPRSQFARRAVLEAVDDLLVEVGYGAMTMKGIAERAGVGRQTVYRWWSTKAEILLEACGQDAAEEMTTVPRQEPDADLLAYLRAVNAFLSDSPPGLAYRALLGEAQHDPDVLDLIRRDELLTASARPVLDRNRARLPLMPGPTLAAGQLVGPVMGRIMATSRPVPGRMLTEHVACLVRAWR